MNSSSKTTRLRVGLRSLALVALSLRAILASGWAHEVIVVSNLTAEGKNLHEPSADYRPRFVLISGGNRTSGAPIAGDRAASAEEVGPLLHRAVVASGYADATPASANADLIVVYYWGCMAPILVVDGNEREVFFNREEMLSLVGGTHWPLAPPGFEAHDALFAAARERRYFVFVSAYDGAAYATNKTKRLLWTMRMSICADGLTQSEAMPMLVAAGGDWFGRETPVPRRIVVAASHRPVPP